MQRSASYRYTAGCFLTVLFASFLWLHGVSAVIIPSGSTSELFEKVFDFNAYAHMSPALKVTISLLLIKKINQIKFIASQGTFKEFAMGEVLTARNYTIQSLPISVRSFVLRI